MSLLRLGSLFFILLFAAETRQASLEYQVKGALLYNICKFIEWPPEAFRDQAAPVMFCVIGRDPFGEDLERILGNRRIHDRPVIVRRISRVEDKTGCHVLFVSSSEKERTRKILDAAAQGPILTVGDYPGFGRQGGSVDFIKEAGKVRFEVNPAAAGRAGLRFSSLLLRVARVVEE